MTKLKSEKKIVITKDANIADLIFKYPEAEEVFLAFGLHCVGCFASAVDTIEVGAKVHGMSDEDIVELVKEINRVINESNESHKS